MNEPEKNQEVDVALNVEIDMLSERARAESLYERGMRHY
jgi:hypothetical protein